MSKYGGFLVVFPVRSDNLHTPKGKGKTVIGTFEHTKGVASAFQTAESTTMHVWRPVREPLVRPC